MMINKVSQPIPGKTVPIPWQMMEVIHAKTSDTSTSQNQKIQK